MLLVRSGAGAFLVAFDFAGAGSLVLMVLVLALGESGACGTSADPLASLGRDVRIESDCSS
jgi:hypothetical protein